MVCSVMVMNNYHNISKRKLKVEFTVTTTFTNTVIFRVAKIVRYKFTKVISVHFDQSYLFFIYLLKGLWRQN